MSSMLNQQHALAKLRTEIKKRERRVYWECRKFGYLVHNCRNKKEEMKGKLIPQNKFEVIASRVMQCGVREEVYHKWPLTDLWLVDLIIKVLKKVKLDKQQKMLLSLRLILRHTVLKYMIVVVCVQEQPTTWSLPIVLHIGVLLFLK